MNILLEILNYPQQKIKFTKYHYVCFLFIKKKNIYLKFLAREREYEIETAVGYCAHIVFIISQFIQLPLRFPIEYYGASSVKIYDYNVQTTE